MAGDAARRAFSGATPSVVDVRDRECLRRLDEGMRIEAVGHTCVEATTNRRSASCAVCYAVSMTTQRAAKRARGANKTTPRRGATVTFSVSVDPETKRALRALADDRFGGNMSALIADIGAEARRRLAAGRLLQRMGIPQLTDDETKTLRDELALETQAVATAGKTRPTRGRRAA